MTTSAEPKRILIAYDGTRGDSQPYVIAATILQEAGYVVQLCGPGDAAAMAADYQLPFTRVRLSMNKVLDDGWVKALTENKTYVPSKRTDTQAQTDEYAAMRNLLLAFKPDLIIAALLLLPQAIMWSKLDHDDVPIMMLHLYRNRACSSSNMFFLRLPRCMNWPINRLFCKLFLNHTLELPLIRKALSEEEKNADLRVSVAELLDHFSSQPTFPNLLAESQAIIGDMPAEFDMQKIHMLGPLMLPPERQLGGEFGEDHLREMKDFLERGDAPVYMGWGSMKVFTPKYMTLLCVRALQLAGLRGVINGGWSQMSFDELDGEPDSEMLQEYCQQNVLFMNKSPHGVLFPQCQILMHHGGAGTLNAAVRAGKPSIVVPVAFDQFDNAKQVEEMGFGLGLKHISKQTPASLSAAIMQCVHSEKIQKRADELGAAVRKEDEQAPAKLRTAVGDYIRDYVDTGLYKTMVRDLREKRAKGGCKCC